MTSAYIFDTETTGFVDPQVIQAASCEVRKEGVCGPVQSQFYKNTKQIELGAMATHHIVSSDLQQYKEWEASEVLRFLPGQYMIGHNVDYDWGVIGKPPIQRICTLSMARTWWPELDSHSQSALMYFHFGEDARDMLREAHDAAADVDNLSKLWCGLFYPKLKQIIGLDPDWRQVWLVSEDCRIPRIMTFGKYKGQPINDVDRGYIQWYLRQPDQDMYVTDAFRRILKGERL